jgi:catalase
VGAPELSKTPANIVPGIGLFPGKMLQGGLFSCGDAKRNLLGINHHLSPANRARWSVNAFYQEGAMR